MTDATPRRKRHVASVDDLDFGPSILSVPPGIRLTIRRRAKTNLPAAVEEVDWPADWPLPVVGSTVLAGELNGWVEFIEFDLRAGRISVILR